MPFVEYPWKHCFCVVGAATDSTSVWEVGATFHDHRFVTDGRPGHPPESFAVSARRLDTRHHFQPVGEVQRHV